MRTRRLALCSLSFVFAFLTAVTIARDVAVRGYIKKNGTYVPPHMRSVPDGNPYNNWNFPGNTNPYTGKVATGDPNAYSQRYYRERAIPSSTAPINILAPPELASAQKAAPDSHIQNVLPKFVSEGDHARSPRFCERLSGADRTYPCQSAAPSIAPGPQHLSPPPNVETSEWSAAVKYCAWLYGDNRAGAHGCEEMQANGLTSAQRRGLMNAAIDPQRRGYCEHFYREDRAGFWNCVGR